MSSTSESRKKIIIVEQTQTQQIPSSPSRSNRKSNPDFSVPPIKAIETSENDEFVKLYFEYDSDEEYEYSTEFVPLKKRLRCHPFHPHHSLALTSVQGVYKKHYCSACNMNIRGTCYSCEDWTCRFMMHCDCASLPPTITNEHLPGDFQPPHPHNLCIFETINYFGPPYKYKWLCSACGEIIDDTFVRCVLCDFTLHLQCDQRYQLLPDPINFTTTTTTTITTADARRQRKTFHLDKLYLKDHEVPPICIICKQLVWSTRQYYYKCTTKRSSEPISAHIGCALSLCETLKIQLNQRKHITHSSHEHPLYLRDDLCSDFLPCHRCKEHISNYMSTYTCHLCRYYIHKSCLDLPLTITHPFHSDHPHLYLQAFSIYVSHRVASCYACQGRISDSGWIYSCRKCNEFSLHPICALFFENVYLPDTINDSKCHLHTLTLKTRLVEDEEQWCDACEERRDPNDCLYYCHMCNFQVHVKCVSFEVLSLLEQTPDGVKLVCPRTIFEVEKLKHKKEDDDRRKAEKSKVKNSPTLNEVLCSYIEQEDDAEIDKVCEALEDITWDNMFGENNKFDASEELLYSVDSIIEFTSKLNSKSTLEENKMLVYDVFANQYGGEHVVRVREHQVTRNFATILEDLFARHGNFCASCTLSPSLKMLFCVAFCEVVHKMCNTWVKDVTEDLLLDWWNRLTMARPAGFQIQFVFNHFKKLVYAHFGFRADSEAFEKMNEVRVELDELPKRIEAVAKKLEEDKRRLKKLKDDEKKLREAFRGKKNRLMKDCLLEFEEIIYDRASAGLL